MAAAGPREEHPCATPGPEPPPVHAAEINRRVFFRHRGLLTWPLTGLRAGPAIGREHEGPLAVDGLDPACCEPEAATWRATAPGPGRAQRPGERTRACAGARRRRPAGRVVPRPARPLSACRASRTSSSAGRAVPPGATRAAGPVRRPRTQPLPRRRNTPRTRPLAAGTNEVVDLVGAAVVLEGGDGRAAARVLFCSPQGQAFLTLAPAGLRGGHRSVLSRPDSGTWPSSGPVPSHPSRCLPPGHRPGRALRVRGRPR